MMGKGWIRVLIVAFVAIAAAILWIAQPDVATAAKMEAAVDGQNLEVSERILFPITPGEQTQKIAAIDPGPVIVFEGSWCALVGGRWIAYPPDTVCP
ncbi:MAG TPA: hypothetical protein VK429_01190 [Patescibacteria group bacterium]|nr:hypothetical protein [Patescibacteria group bacterium]